MDGRRGDSMAGTAACSGARLSWNDAVRTPVAAVWLSVVAGACRCCSSGFLPGSKFIACCPITILPDVAVKTGRRLIPFCSPPVAASQGSQTLYDEPSSESLWWLVNCSGVNAYLRSGDSRCESSPESSYA